MYLFSQFSNTIQYQDDEAAQLAKSLMSKKAARLYGRMQHGIAQKQAKVDNLHKKRREIESSREKTKDGKTITKLKVERLKKERKETENAYAETGGKRYWLSLIILKACSHTCPIFIYRDMVGSMKKKRKKN